MSRTLILLASLGSAIAGTVLWDGRFNEFTSSTDLNNWSWSNQVGPYQYYIHGSGNVTEYVNLAPSYKNPADTSSAQGVKITLDSTAYWNGQTMRRTELIPQTTAAINSGHVFYHFSMKRASVNPPSLFREHQICFFESHFTEMKSGWISGEAGTSDPLLRWDVGGVTKWNSSSWDADTWHNIAYEIDFTANTVAFWHSTGSDPLVLTVAAVSQSTSSNGADWHLGVLELPRDGYTDTDEDYYFSGVYVETGTITTSVSGPGGITVVSSSSVIASTSTTTKPASSTSTSKVTTSTPPPSTLSTSTVKSSTGTSTTMKTTSSTVTSSSKAATSTNATVVPKWGQCGGQDWTGGTECVSGSTCTYSNLWYSQCL